jgi:threonyl-tRNA synthetase
VASRLREEGLRAEVDESKETVGKKVRASQQMKVPYTLVAGDHEVDAGTIAVRDRAGVEKRGVQLEAFVARAVSELRSRAVETGDLAGLA